ncbi:apolipoprotein N-acyltransferase [Parafrankia sp. EAN1pec]|uniref:apolipoprotein N-acyltransferase n=1 Tax=Parafrankia sp. (strain EAN1pec) TaxID=298653 RepID=UPI0000545116|nr:apolipoprotein N-acyltransferase [Frankia sp. EAN1pec]
MASSAGRPVSVDAGGHVRLVPTRWSRWRYRALSALLGAVPAVAFPALSAWPVGFVGMVPATLVIVAATVPREAAIRAWCGGTGFFLATCYWLVPNTGPFIVVLGLALGVTWMLWGVLVWTALRPRLPSQPPGYRRLAWALVAVPSGWVIGEFARSWEGFGGPWALLGASQWNARPFLPLAAVGGVWLLSFLLAAVNLLVAAAVMPGLRPGRRRPWRAGVALAAGLLVAVMVAGAAAVPTPANTGTLTVGGVQPGVVHGADVRFADGEAATRSLVGAGVDLVVWGESSVGFDLVDDQARLRQLEDLSRMLGVPVLVNTDARRADEVAGPDDGDGGIYKSAVLVGPDGPRGRYDKMRLVPFGEYIPLRPVFGWLTAVTEAAAENRRKGVRLTVLAAGKLDGRTIRLGPLVCFESAFPDMTLRLANDGADVVVVQSATSTFQDSWAPDQHASLAALRAVEAGRPVLHATLTGVSTAFDASGRQLFRLGRDGRGAYVVDLPLTSATGTPYARLGDWVPLGSLAIVAAVALDAAVLRAVRLHRARRSTTG